MKRLALTLGLLALFACAAVPALAEEPENRADLLFLAGFTGDHRILETPAGENAGSAEVGFRLGSWIATAGVGMEFGDVAEFDFEDPARGVYGLASAGLAADFLFDSHVALVAAIETPYFTADRGEGFNVGIGGLLIARRLVLGATYFPKMDHRATVRLGVAF